MKNIVAIIGFVFVISVLASTFYCVGEAETVIVTRFGRIASVADQAGLHLKLPLVTQLLRFDRRYQALGTLSTRVETAESTEVNVDYLVIGQIDDPQRFFRATGGDSQSAVAQLTPILTNALRERLRASTLHQLIAEQATSLTFDQQKQLNRALVQLGMRVIDIRIKQINFPNDSPQMASIYQRMRAQRLREAAAIRADGEEQSIIIRAKADQDAAVLAADAQRDAQRIHGQAEAEAARITARAAAQDPAFYSFYRGLAAYRQAMSTGDAVIILRNDDPFLPGLIPEH